MGSPAAANAAEKGFAASALVPAPFPDAATNMDMSMAIVAGSAAGAGAGAGAALIPSIAANVLYAGAGTFEGTIQGMWNDGAAGTDSARFLGLLDIDAPASAVSPGASRRACTNATRDANVAHGSAPKTAGAPFWSTYAICSALGSYLPPRRPRGADEVRERDVQGVEIVDRAEVDFSSRGRAAARPRGRGHELDVALHHPRRAARRLRGGRRRRGRGG